MKNHAIKVTDIRNGFKILGICILVFFPLWAHAQSTKPEKKVLEFYQKYMTACARPFLEQPNLELDGLFCNMDIKNYVTQELYKKIVHAYKAGVYGDLAGDSDYFTHTQDFSVEWTSGMKATEIEKRPNSSVVRLLMHFPKGAGEPLAVCVRLRRDGNDWKIYQVDPSLYTDLPDCKGK
jgi:glucose-6-phosphate 1-dehydrogenase